MIYNKLVRDKIPEHIREKGGVPVTHIEFQEDENIEELADILEVVDAIIEYKEFKKEEIEKVKEKKAEERGKFNLKIILEES